MLDSSVLAVLKAQVTSHPYPLLFATISGAHLYGFASPDSDFDLRGAHLLPLTELAGLDPLRETVEESRVVDGLEIDLVSHDLRKFALQLLRPNGYVLEQLLSPLVVHSSSEHEELMELGRGCITRRHVNHYDGFARAEWDRLLKLQPPTVKSLLYVYRVLLTGIHLMRSGEVDANLPRLAEEYGLQELLELVARKQRSSEKGALGHEEIESHRKGVEALQVRLIQEAERSHLPDQSSMQEPMNDFVVRVRLNL